LKALIERANLTQRQLSHMTNVTERNINDWIRGATLPRLDRAAALARALGVSMKELCEALGVPTEGIPDDCDGNNNFDEGGNELR
jgi:transcriptional regulator with XRE-family HTH domain